MKSTPEHQDRPIVIPDKPAAQQPKPDTFSKVRDGIYKNDRTGQLETRLPLPSSPFVHPVFDEQARIGAAVTGQGGCSE